MKQLKIQFRLKIEKKITKAKRLFRFIHYKIKRICKNDYMTHRLEIRLKRKSKTIHQKIIQLAEDKFETEQFKTWDNPSKARFLLKLNKHLSKGVTRKEFIRADRICVIASDIVYAPRHPMVIEYDSGENCKLLDELIESNLVPQYKRQLDYYLPVKIDVDKYLSSGEFVELPNVKSTRKRVFVVEDDPDVQFLCYKRPNVKLRQATLDEFFKPRVLQDKQPQVNLTNHHGLMNKS